MKTINKNFYLIYFFITLTLISLVVLVIKISTLNTDNILSKSYFQESFFQKERELADVIYTYSTSIKSLHQNPYLYEYIVNHRYEEVIQEIFLQNKKSLPLFFQIRYLDKNGDEKIRVDGDSIALYKDEARSNITPKKELQNKADKDYFNQFMKLAPGEIGYSVIDLNKDNGVVTLPKEPTLRIGMASYGDKREPQGVLIYNVSLRYFITHLSLSVRYNFMMIDKEGDFLVHYKEKYGLLGDNLDYNIKDEFPNEYQNILKYDKYETPSLYSSNITNFENGQGIKLILTMREDKKESLSKWLIDNIILFIIIISLILLPIVRYFVKNYNKENYADNSSSR